MISLPACFSVCDVGPMSVPCSPPAFMFMHVLEDSELKHNFPGQQLSQPSLGVNLPFPFGPSLRFLVQGEGGDPGTESCLCGFMEGLPEDSYHCCVVSHALCMPAPCCPRTCMHVPVHASPLTPLRLRALGPLLVCPGRLVQPASILPQVLLTFSLPPNSSWT